MRTDQNKKKKGISIQFINLSFIIIIFIFSYTVDTTNHGIQKKYNDAVLSQDKMIACNDAANALRRESDELTLYINNYLSDPTGDGEAKYYKIIDQMLREQELGRAERYDVDCTSLKQALSLSNELAEHERHAFALVNLANGTLPSANPQVQSYPLSEAEKNSSPEDQIEQAHQLIHGSEYNRYKQYIYDKIETFERSVVTAAEKDLQEETKGIADATNRMHKMTVLGNMLIVLAAYVLYRMVTVVLHNYISSVLRHEYVKPKGASELKYLGSVFNEYIALQKNAQKELRHKAKTDELTQIANRRGLESFMQNKLNEPDTQGAFLFLDIDNFKKINDSYGHDAGDEVIIQIVHDVKKHFRDGDFIGRFGGDEFAIWLDGITEKTAGFIRQRMKRLGKGIHLSDGTCLDVTVSAGVVFCKSGDQYSEVFKHADQALYEKKRSGKHGCIIDTNF